jgi:hypothetical protein
MLSVFSSLFRTAQRSMRSRAALQLEILALRHHIAASRAFYEKLGFRQVAGDQVQNLSLAKTPSGGAVVILERIEGCGTCVAVHARLTALGMPKAVTVYPRAASTPAKLRGFDSQSREVALTRRDARYR